MVESRFLVLCLLFLSSLSSGQVNTCNWVGRPVELEDQFWIDIGKHKGLPTNYPEIAPYYVTRKYSDELVLQ